MNGRKKPAAGVIATGSAAVLLAVLAGCSAGQETYAPAAYGVPGYCYYVDSPAEAVALEAAGLCPQSWVPALMPLAWHETYWGYYSSTSYYDTYVPVRSRTVYVTKETSFGRTNRSAITTRSNLATYRSSSGTVVKGTKVTGKLRFGSGTSSGSSSSKSGSSSSSKSGSSGSSSFKSSSSRSGSSGSSSFKSSSSRSSSSGSRSSGSHR